MISTSRVIECPPAARPAVIRTKANPVAGGSLASDPGYKNRGATTFSLAGFRSGKQKLPHLALWIVHHPAIAVEHHRPPARRLVRLPFQAGLARIARPGEIRPRRRHFPGKCLGIRPIAGSLIAAP